MTQAKEIKDADSFEQRHVHETYEAIAKHFSASRYKEWSQVALFLQQLPPYAMVADAGCGNGKYFECAQFLYVGQKEDRETPIALSLKGRKKPKRARASVQFEKEWIKQVQHTRRFVVGYDRCRALLQHALVPGTAAAPSVCPPQGTDLVCCDVQFAPFRSGVFDAAICVAVLHHYATPARRRAALQRLLRLVREDGGQVLIYVWALEQPRKRTHEVDEESGDAWIPWQMNQKFDDHQKVYQRYYHLFREGELEQLCFDALHEERMKGEIIKSYFDKENWCVVVQRHPSL